ncbi:hypothetical protein Leryth_018453 [Lithospermum erythrorhizon]|nr:hypothetical protein Leryth_018453 [Lithospermum erythrorhizon]
MKNDEMKDKYSQLDWHGKHTTIQKVNTSNNLQLSDKDRELNSLKNTRAHIFPPPHSKPNHHPSSNPTSTSTPSNAVPYLPYHNPSSFLWPSRKSDSLLPTPFSHGGTTIRHYQSDGILPTPTDHQLFLRRYNGAFSPQGGGALLGQDLFHTDSTGSSDKETSNSYGLSHDDSGMNHFYSKVSFNSVHNRDGSNQTEDIIEDLDPDPPTSETSTNWDEQFDQNKILLDSSSSPGLFSQV